MERAAVVDPHDHAAPVFEVGHARKARQRQGAVRGGELGEVVGFQARGHAPVELGAVPRGHAAFDVARCARQHDVGLSEHGVRRTIAVVRERLGVRDGFGQVGDVGWDIGRAVGHTRRVQPAVRVRAERLPGLAARMRLRLRRGGRLRLLFRLWTRTGREQERRQGQPCGAKIYVLGWDARNHGVASGSFPAIASASWYTAIAYIGERL